MQGGGLDPRWDDLHTLLAIARGGSLQRAAETLGVHHSTVYRRLGAIEKVFGTVLFDRDGYLPTPAGEVALSRAERVEEEVLALQRELVGLERVPGGSVRLTAPPDMLELLLPHIAAFRHAEPRIRIELWLADRALDLSRLEADVALRATQNPPESAVGRRLCGIAWGSYARVGAPTDGPWVVFTESLAHLDAVRWWRDRCPADDVALAVSSVMAMHAAVGAGIGRGLLPFYLGTSDPRLVALDAPAPPSSSLWLLLHPDLRRTARVRRFVDFIGDRIASERGRFEGSGLIG